MTDTPTRLPPEGRMIAARPTPTRVCAAHNTVYVVAHGCRLCTDDDVYNRWHAAPARCHWIARDAQGTHEETRP